MSARIVVNLEHGLAESAVDRTPDGGVWLSIWQASEVVIVKLSLPSLQALCLTLAKDLAETAAPAGEDKDLLETSGRRRPFAEPEPPFAEPAPPSAPAERA
jgi:hypothetical protein